MYESLNYESLKYYRYTLRLVILWIDNWYKSLDNFVFWNQICIPHCYIYVCSVTCDCWLPICREMTLGRIAEFIEDCERSKMLFHPSFINISQHKCVPCYGMYHNLQNPLLVLGVPSTETQLLLNSMWSTKRIRK